MCSTFPMEELIENVRSYEFLYDMRCRDYRDQNKRQQAWEDIGANLGKTWQQCRDTWTKLRNAYTNAVKRRKVLIGQGARKIAKWKFEDQMCFLIPHMEPRSSLNGYSTDIVDTQGSDTNSSFIDLGIKREEPEYQEFSAPESNKLTSKIVPLAILSKSDHKFDPLSTTSYSRNAAKISKKVITEKAASDIVEVMQFNRAQNMPPSTVQSTAACDETELFFLSLARTVKKLPQSDQIHLRMDISNLVFQAELRNIDFQVPQKVTPPYDFSVALSPAQVPSPSDSSSSTAEVYNETSDL